MAGRLSEDRNFEEGALYAGKNALIYDSVQEEGNIYTVLKNSSRKYVDSFEVIKGELIFSSQNKQELDWAQEIGIKVSPYLIIDGELMSSNQNLYLMDEATGTITIPENVTKIGAGAFRDVTGLRSIVIPGTVKEIGDYAFSGNPTLENVVIEEGVERIGAYAFQGCATLKTIRIADSVSEILDSCFGQCTSLSEINFPKSLKTITFRMLNGCDSLTELEIPEGVTRIDGLAFERCRNLTKIKIPATVTALSGSAFQYDNKLINIEISTNNKNYSFADSMLMSKNGEILFYVVPSTSIINVPESVKTIELGAVSGYSRTSVLNISKNVQYINEIFATTNITAINVVEENPYFKSENGNLYNKDMTILYRYYENQPSFIMPNTVKEIRQNAFLYETKLEQLTLSDNLEEISGWQFASTKIKNLHFGSKVKNISTTVFSDIEGIDITIAEENPNIKVEGGTYILSKDGKTLIGVSKNLATYNIPDTVETIGDLAFYNKGYLKEINLPANIKTIESAAFDACGNLEKIEIPASVGTIAIDAFSRCNSLREIIIDKKEGEISGAPWSCPYGLRAIKWQP